VDSILTGKRRRYRKQGRRGAAQPCDDRKLHYSVFISGGLLGAQGDKHFVYTRIAKHRSGDGAKTLSNMCIPILFLQLCLGPLTQNSQRCVVSMLQLFSLPNLPINTCGKSMLPGSRLVSNFCFISPGKASITSRVHHACYRMSMQKSLMWLVLRKGEIMWKSIVGWKLAQDAGKPQHSHLPSENVFAPTSVAAKLTVWRSP
jgi:hypothetical protein